MRILKLTVAGLALAALSLPLGLTQAITEAPTAFVPDPENPAHMKIVSNGFTSQEQFELDADVFDEREGADDGLGPV
jgi:hypothetical protein